MDNTRSIRLLSVREKVFSMDVEKIPATEKECERLIKPAFGFHLSIDKDNSTLTADVKVFYGYPDKPNEVVASLEFSYTIFIERIEEVFIEGKNEKTKITAPVNLMKTIINDIYVTARTLISIHLVSTPLRDLYLPFDGASPIIDELGS